MKERPILFSRPMVRAILDGRKTQTRRVVKPQPDGFHHSTGEPSVFVGAFAKPIACPYGVPGDRLWVREKLKRCDAGWWYAADDTPVLVCPQQKTQSIVWAHHKLGDVCVSIHMPRWARRITLEVTGVRVERLQEISEGDSIAEGFRHSGSEQSSGFIAAADGFFNTWESLNSKRGHPWSSNPWVWVIEFKRIEATGGYIMSDLDHERRLIEVIETLHLQYERAAKPYFDELVRLRAMRLQHPVVVPLSAVPLEIRPRTATPKVTT